MLKDLDREEIPVYSIIIKASSNRSWTPPRGHRSARAKALDPARDPSLLEVRIELEDINDQKPRFVKQEYTAGNQRSLTCERENQIKPLKHSLLASLCQGSQRMLKLAPS